MALKFIFIFSFAVAVSGAGIPSKSHPIHEYHHEHQHQQQPNSQTDYHHAAHYQHVAPASHHQHILVQKQLHKQDEHLYEIDSHPQYNFSYDVQDSISGDSKRQIESRDGDVVHGEYSLNDADGFRRTVKYTASDANGFSAVVHREPLPHKAVIATATAPEQHFHYVAPAAHAAPSGVSKAPLVHEQHSSYATYEQPKQSTHENYHHHH